jgi:16S rRNA (guanine966-N2)-methyltransferase
LQRNRVRIIGGEWRGRLISFPARDSLRPTPDRVRETLFNWLGQDLSGKGCLDLFAGSGALGFEAASRGARLSVLVENDPVSFEALRENAARLKAAQVRPVLADALNFLESDTLKYDVIFVDPPYRANVLRALIPELAEHAAPDGQLYVETADFSEWLPELESAGWRVRRQTQAGKVRSLLCVRVDSNEPIRE